MLIKPHSKHTKHNSLKFQSMGKVSYKKAAGRLFRANQATHFGRK